MPFSVSLERIVHFAEDFPIGIFVADADGVSIRSNRVARERVTDENVGTRLLAEAMREDRVIGPVLVAATRLIAIPLHDENAAMTGCVAFSLDAGGRSTSAIPDDFLALAKELPHIAWVTDAAGAPLAFNRSWHAYSAIDPSDAASPGGWARIVAAHDRDRASAVFASAIRNGAELYEDELRLVRADGEVRRHLAHAVPVRDAAGAVTRWFGTFTDVEDRRIAEAAHARDVRDVTDALPLIVWTARPTGEIEYYNRRWYEYTGLPSDHVPRFGWSDLVHPDDFSGTVLAYARGLESGGRFTIDSRLRGADGTYRWHRSVAEPVRNRDGTITRWVGSTLDIEGQTRAQAAQERLLMRAEQTSAQLRFLADVGRTLSRSLDFDETASAIVGQVVPTYGDWSVLRLMGENGRLRTIAHAHREPESLPILEALFRGEGHFDIANAASMESARTQHIVVHERMDPGSFEGLDTALAPRSCVVIPLVFAGKVNGILQIVYAATNRYYSTDDIALLEEVARRCASALANAIRYGREHRVADRLQRALLPSVLPRVDNVALDAFYSAGRMESQIGGDWFDAFRVTENRLVLTIGDVCGSGLEAAVTMAAVRQSIRSLSQVDPDPRIVLNMVDRTLRSEDPSALVTAYLLIFDTATRELTYASAGHPPPLLLEPDGSVRVLHEPDLPLGVRDGDNPPARTIIVEPGSVLVLYTDGVTETTRDAIEGERRLIAALRDAPVENTDISLAKHLAAMVLPDGSIDDAAILTMRYG